MATMSEESELFPKNPVNMDGIQAVINRYKAAHDDILQLKDLELKSTYYDKQEKAKQEFRESLTKLLFPEGSCRHPDARLDGELYHCVKCGVVVTTDHWPLGTINKFGGVFINQKQVQVIRKQVDAFFKEWPMLIGQTDICDHSGCG